MWVLQVGFAELVDLASVGRGVLGLGEVVVVV